MAIQLILCLEADRKSGTDYVYVSEVIHNFYEIDNTVKITPIYMGGKSKYNHKSIVNEIKEKISQYKHGNTKVIYVTDTDNLESIPEDKVFLDRVTKYCQENGYDHAWFCHDVEEVFWMGKTSINSKVKMAGEFKKKRIIETIDERKLKSQNMRTGCSNILTVLDRYLRKK